MWAVRNVHVCHETHHHRLQQQENVLRQEGHCKSQRSYLHLDTMRVHETCSELDGIKKNSLRLFCLPGKQFDIKVPWLWGSKDSQAYFSRVWACSGNNFWGGGWKDTKIGLIVLLLQTQLVLMFAVYYAASWGLPDFKDASRGSNIQHILSRNQRWKHFQHFAQLQYVQNLLGRALRHIKDIPW